MPLCFHENAPLKTPRFLMNHKGTKTQRDPLSDHVNNVARIAVHTAFAVHSQLGPGLLESVYQKCLAHGIGRRGLVVESQRVVPIEFEGMHFRSDIGRKGLRSSTSP